MLKAHFQLRCQPVKIVRQQLHRKIIRRFHWRPRHASLLVGAEQRTLAFLPHINLAGKISGIDDFMFEIRQFGNGLGDDVVMLHRQNRQFYSHHMADFARPKPRRIDHMLGMDCPLIGFHVPGMIRPLLEREHAGKAVYLSAMQPRSLG